MSAQVACGCKETRKHVCLHMHVCTAFENIQATGYRTCSVTYLTRSELGSCTFWTTSSCFCNSNFNLRTWKTIKLLLWWKRFHHTHTRQPNHQTNGGNSTTDREDNQRSRWWKRFAFERDYETITLWQRSLHWYKRNLKRQPNHQHYWIGPITNRSGLIANTQENKKDDHTIT